MEAEGRIKPPPPSRVMVAMLGARRNYAVPMSLNKVGALEHFYTDICGHRGWPRYLNYLPERIQPGIVKRLTGRVPHGLPPRKLTSFPDFGLSYAYKLYKAQSLDEKIEVFKWAGDCFAERIGKTGFGNADTVYIFDHNGLDLIEKAKSAGLRTVVDVTVPTLEIEQKILQEEQKKFQGWEFEHNRPSKEAVAKLSELDRKAWKCADVLICGSEYVKQSVREFGGESEKCAVVPYGLPDKLPIIRKKQVHSLRLRVLTVGTLSLRKGTPYLLEVAKRLKEPAAFRAVGGSNLKPEITNEIGRYINLIGPVPRSDIAEHYAWADVFLLPSLNEGSAAATYEALSFGLPVICTPNTGSVVRDGIDGFIVDPRDVDAIVERLMLLNSSQSLRREMMHNAKQRAKEFNSKSYGERLLSALEKHTANPVIQKN